MKKRFNLIFNILMVALVGYLAYQKFVVNKPQKDIDVHQLKIKDKNGRLVDFNDYEGKPIFINFYSSWCGPCMIEMPSIEKLYQSFQDEDEILFLIVNTTSMADIQNFERKHSIELPQYLLLDSGNIPIKTIPLTYVLNKKGEVVQVVNRPKNWNTKRAKKNLQELIDEQ